MSDVLLSVAHRAARSQASIALADAEPGAATLRFYDEPDGVLLAIRTLDRPCGTVDEDGFVNLHAASASIDLVARSGDVAWAEWCNGAGAMLLGCDVTDAAGGGPIQMTGATGTAVQAGGVVKLVEPVVLG